MAVIGAIKKYDLGLYTMQEDKTEDLVANGHEVALAELKEMDAMGEIEEI